MLARTVVATVLLGFAAAQVLAAGFGTDDRIEQPRVKGTFYGAIGLVVHTTGLETEAGTGFLVSPCHVMTAYHVVAGKEKLKSSDTAVFYVGEGSIGPDYVGGKEYALSTKAHPLVWGDFVDGESDNISQRVKSIRNDGWQDWVLLKLDRCFGDPENGYGYLKLKPFSTRELTRSGATPSALAVGLPKDRDDQMLTEDPSCRVLGQMSASGWQHDCMILPGNSGGPVMEHDPSAPGEWPRVLGITVSLAVLDGLDEDQSDATILSADDPSYFGLLSNMVPVSSFINKVAQYLPPDPVVSAYIAQHRLDIGYDSGDDLDYDAAIADFGTAIAATPNDAELHVRRGLWFASDDKAQEAIDDFTAALKIRPGYPAALLSRSQSFSDRADYAQHDLANAIADLDSLLHQFPESAELMLNRAFILGRDQRFEDAIADYDHVLKLRPKSAGTFEARGNAYAELQNFNDAAKDYDRAVDIEPKEPSSYIARGNFRSQIGDDDGALADFNHALQLLPSSPDAYSGRAYVLLQQGKTEVAMQDFDLALKYDEKNAFVLGGRASLNEIMGNHEAALNDYAQAVSLDPSEPFIQLLLFIEKARAGKAEEAKKNFADFAADTRFDDWPRTLARFFAGEIDAAAVERIADQGNAYERRAHAFDRDFYLGQAALIAGNNADAQKRLQAVIATGDRQYIEYNIAAADLAKLGGTAMQSSATPPPSQPN
ncbi:MAG TPA: tetratricopeptide repeat protein [Candidatus Cybelea sp.]|nr:tetratricopeptide repeat protein [Candidatus Cybelea sp.]